MNINNFIFFCYLKTLCLRKAGVANSLEPRDAELNTTDFWFVHLNLIPADLTADYLLSTARAVSPIQVLTVAEGQVDLRRKKKCSKGKRG